MRGYYGIGVMLPKSEVNIGTLLRSAMIFDAAFVFTIGRRYRKQSSDTTQSWRHLPLHHYDTLDAFFDSGIPYSCVPIGVELTDKSIALEKFSHPERAIYLLGPEDGSIPKAAQERLAGIVQIPGRFCLNVAVAGSIVMYDRTVKRGIPCPTGTLVPDVSARMSPELTAVGATTARSI